MKKISLILASFLIFTFMSPIQANETVTIQFYDENAQLIQTQTVGVNEYFDVPTVSKQGYNFLGFNTALDGSGEYLNSYKAEISKRYYAVYTPIIYQVHYYADGKYLQTQSVPYGSNAPEIAAPQKDGMLFSGWVGLTNITEERTVNAEYVLIVEETPKVEEKPSEEPEVSASIKLDNKNDHNNEINEVEDLKEKNEKKITVIKQENEYNYFPLFIVFLGTLIIVLLILKQFKSKK